MKFGRAFSDNLEVSNRREHHLTREKNAAWWLGAGRVLMFTVLLFATFFILVLRLANLAIVQGHRYRILAEANRTRELVRHAPRGIIRDRTGAPLVDNIVTYRLLKPCPQERTFINSHCVEFLTKEEGEALATTGLPKGTFLETDYERRYKSSEAIAHVIGYTGEISETELDAEFYTLRGYARGDRIGRMGTESIFEDRLRGRDGKELVEVDSEGRLLRMLGRDSELPGSDVTLSIHGRLSETVAKSFPNGFKGAVIVSNPQTGEILASYSSPTFDPNDFSIGMSQEEYSALATDPALPMFNRAIAGSYPPGSTFKLVTALAGMEQGIITPQTIIEDTGIIYVGKFSFSNWYFTQYGKTEGSVDLVKAIARSNDIYFYKIGEKIGIDSLSKWAKNLGVGKISGIELAGETSGLMPDPAWKKKTFTTKSDREARNNLWYDGDTYHIAIGQGYLLTTPLQVNQWTNAIATGKLCRPTIEKISDNSAHTQFCNDLHLRATSREAIIGGMVKACDTGGTGWPLFGFGIRNSQENEIFTRIPVACKTGTSEFGDPAKRTHAWFTVFAPIPESYTKNLSPQTGVAKTVTGNPEISITVLVEGGGEGSRVAAPIAKEILETWFSGNF